MKDSEDGDSVASSCACSLVSPTGECVCEMKRCILHSDRPISDFPESEIKLIIADYQ